MLHDDDDDVGVKQRAAAAACGLPIGATARAGNAMLHPRNLILHSVKEDVEVWAKIPHAHTCSHLHLLCRIFFIPFFPLHFAKKEASKRENVFIRILTK